MALNQVPAREEDGAGRAGHDLLSAAKAHPFVARAAARTRLPRVLIDGHCRILWASTHAAELLRPPLPLVVSDGHLCVTVGGERGRAWSAFVESIVLHEQSHFIPGESSASWVLVRAWEDQHEGKRAVFVECSPSIPLQDVESSGLATEFGLTRGECSVLDQFAQLRRPDEIAEELGVSLSTVRSHLKPVHTKLGVNSSVHLLRITRAYTDR